jgi:hypothetical protein
MISIQHIDAMTARLHGLQRVGEGLQPLELTRPALTDTSFIGRRQGPLPALPARLSNPVLDARLT